MILLSFLAHHAEAGDPDLLDWIKHQIDAIIGVGPLFMVVVLGLVLVSRSNRHHAGIHGVSAGGVDFASADAVGQRAGPTTPKPFSGMYRPPLPLH